jgi:hypothetical protein
MIAAIPRLAAGATGSNGSSRSIGFQMVFAKNYPVITAFPKNGPDQAFAERILPDFAA